MSSSFFHVFDNDIAKVTVSAATKSALRGNCLEMTMFSVGGGEAILLRRGKQVVLVDGGAGDEEENVPLGNFLADYLARPSNKFKLVALVASHPHTDHLNANLPLLNKGGASILTPGARYYDNGEEYPTKLKTGLLPHLNSPSSGLTRITVTKTGKDFTLGADVNISMFVNGDDKPKPPYKSIFMSVKFGQASFLFTGDAYIAYENVLRQSDHKSELAAHVLKITHHGSKYGTGAKFVQDVNPRIAVASTGEETDHTLKQDVIDNLRKNNPHCEIRDTFKDKGDIIIRTDGKSRTIGGNNGVLYEIKTVVPGRYKHNGNS